MVNRIITGLAIMISVALSAGCIIFGEEYTPQQELGYKLIDAVKYNDLSSFKNLFSERVLNKFAEKNQNSDEALRKVLDKYREKFHKRYKEFQNNNFYFNYQGSETEGDLYIFFNDKRSAKKTVVFENNKWVFDEL
jgi:coproporphyrinogen III oxidase